MRALAYMATIYGNNIWQRIYIYRDIYTHPPTKRQPPNHETDLVRRTATPATTSHQVALGCMGIRLPRRRRPSEASSVEEQRQAKTEQMGEEP